jgi:hypothetical protein
VGETGPANFIVSTIIEAENLAGYLREVQAQGREGSVCSYFQYSISCRSSLDHALLLDSFIYNLVFELFECFQINTNTTLGALRRSNPPIRNPTPHLAGW